LAVARELYLDNAYSWPPAVPPLTPRRIADVGANVGLSVVYWAHRFPAAQVVAYEPHPDHVAMIDRQLRLNRLTDRVRVVPAAAADRPGRAFLKAAESQSYLAAGAGPDTLEVPVVDLLDDLAREPVDLLKMDIEGSEYPILGDDRFGRLGIPRVVLEWHNTAAVPDGRGWCAGRLERFGYRVVDGALQRDVAGMMWAWR
jgi:FkbM family methyltransferase